MPATAQAKAAVGARRRLLLALGLVLMVQALFVVSYVGALHDPKPRDLPFGVVGAPGLASAVGTAVSLGTTTYADEAAARRDIDRRKIYGALVTGPEGSKLIVVPAASNGAAVLLASAFGQAAAATHRKLVVETVHPLPARDRAGAVSFLVVMALVVGGYLSATLAMSVAGPATPRRGAMLAGVAVVGALLTYLIAGPVLGAIPSGHFLALWALFTLVMSAVAFATAALQTLFGHAGTLLVIVCFVIFGAPAAGGTVPNPFQPGLWSTIGPYLPPGAGTTAVRNTIYFGGNAIARALIVLAAYLVGGAVVVLLARRRGRDEPSDESTDDAELASAAAASAVVI